MKKYCMKCGYGSESTSKNCDKCKSPLDAVQYSTPSTKPAITLADINPQVKEKQESDKLKKANEADVQRILASLSPIGDDELDLKNPNTFKFSELAKEDDDV